MPTHGDENTEVAQRGMSEGSEEGNISLSPELVDERIKASLEPVHVQISAFTEMMDRLQINPEQFDHGIYDGEFSRARTPT